MKIGDRERDKSIMAGKMLCFTSVIILILIMSYSIEKKQKRLLLNISVWRNKQYGYASDGITKKVGELFKGSS